MGDKYGNKYFDSTHAFEDKMNRHYNEKLKWKVDFKVKQRSFPNPFVKDNTRLEYELSYKFKVFDKLLNKDVEKCIIILSKLLQKTHGSFVRFNEVK